VPAPKLITFAAEGHLGLVLILFLVLTYTYVGLLALSGSSRSWPAAPTASDLALFLRPRGDGLGE
jgi:hypothetical protein